MALFRLLSYDISHICLMIYLLAFTKWRYSAKKTIGLAVIATAALFLLEWIRYVHPLQGGEQRLLYALQMAVIVVTSCCLSQYRDFRGVFTGLFAKTYVLFGNLVGRTLFLLGWGLAFSVGVSLVINLAMMACLLYCLRPNYMELQLVKRKEWAQLSMIPGIFCVARLFLREHLNDPDPMQVLASLSLVLVLYVCYVLLFQLVTKVSREEKLLREKEVLETGTRALRRAQEEVRVAERQIAIQNHDRKHLIRTMQGLMAKADYDAVQRLLSEVQAMPEHPVGSHYCDNAPINGVVSFYMAAAREKQVETHVALDIPEHLPVNEWELAVVLGNLLENAVRAAGETEAGKPRNIRMTAKQVRRQMLIEVLNTYSGTIVFDQETSLPTSPRGEGHGLGMRSVAYFAERTGAAFDCGIEDGLFFVRLLI